LFVGYVIESFTKNYSATIHESVEIIHKRHRPSQSRQIHHAGTYTLEGRQRALDVDVRLRHPSRACTPTPNAASIPQNHIHRAMLCPTAPTTLSHKRRAGSAWSLTHYLLFSLPPPHHPPHYR
jgi:hypothetical protein